MSDDEQAAVERVKKFGADLRENARVFADVGIHVSDLLAVSDSIARACALVTRLTAERDGATHALKNVSRFFDEKVRELANAMNEVVDLTAERDALREGLQRIATLTINMNDHTAVTMARFASNVLHGRNYFDNGDAALDTARGADDE